MRPIYDMLVSAAARGSFHMPGHKGRAPFGLADLYALDTTEIPLTDDLYAPENGILQAEKLYARAAGAAETLFLHNGSTSGIHVMLQLWAREGDTVLLPRNAHLSAVNACIMGGLKVRWIPVTQTADGYCYVREEDVLAALQHHPEAKTLLLTRPDYYGCCIGLERIICAAHAQGTKVVVDEAHGAHFPWLESMQSAGTLGADAWVQSVHKTLPGLTGSAVLHLQNSADRERAIRLLRREQTSSPSFVMMMSIDDARAMMEDKGAAELQRIVTRAEEIRALLPQLGYQDGRTAWQALGLTMDPSRLVIAAPQGGAALAEALQARGIDVEMHDHHRVVLILSAQDTDEDFMRLGDALKDIPATAVELPVLPKVNALPECIMEVRPAVMADCEAVPLHQAAGRIAAVPAGLYPPGIPLVCPGEMIDAGMVAWLKSAAPQGRFGVEGDCLLCVMKNV